MAERPDPTEIFTAADARDFVVKEWQQLWDTKVSLEGRAITLITTSGVLVTLTFGFAAAVAKGKHFGTFDNAEKTALSIALGLFALSAAIALATNFPKSWAVPDFSELLGIEKTVLRGRSSAERQGEPPKTPPAPPDPIALHDFTPMSPMQRLQNAIGANTELIDSKARLLAAAFLVQICAIVILAIDVGIVVS